MFGLFGASLVGQFVAGHREYNADQAQHGQPAVQVGEYFASGHFMEAVFENWESEFLQMAAFVLLTAWLYQKGSPESRKLEGEPEKDGDPKKAKKKDSPWPVFRGGLVLKVYEHSLSLALFLLFAVSFLLHAKGGAREYSQEQLEHGGNPMAMLDYMGTSRFWFESFQNWQSEFLSVIGLLEHAGLKERARTVIAGFRGATTARVLLVYFAVRQITAALGLTSLGGHAQMVRPLIAPMAEAASENRYGELPERIRNKIRANSAAVDNIALFFGEDIFIAIGSILLIRSFLDQNGIQVEPTELAIWAIPTAICAFVIHCTRLLLLDRTLHAELSADEPDKA